MSNIGGTKQQTEAEMWAAFQDDAEEQAAILVPITAEHAREHTCLRCSATDKWLWPGIAGWGCSCGNCGTSMSVSADAEEDDGTRKFRKPFRCFFCRGVIGNKKPYVRMLDPRGGKMWNGKDKVVYLHGDGAACTGRPIVAEEDTACAASCGNVTAGQEVYDMMGVGKAAHTFCRDCKYAKRAAVLKFAQDLMESERVDREASRDKSNDTPRKPAKRTRTE